MYCEKTKVVAARMAAMVILLGLIPLFAAGQDTTSDADATPPQSFMAVGRASIHADSSTPYYSPIFNTSFYRAGLDPYMIAQGDFNKDGNIDLVTANVYDGTISVLLGNGDGTFKKGVLYPATYLPISIAVGDFNGNGKLDLAVLGYASSSNGAPGELVLLSGNGDGTFGAPTVIGSFKNVKGLVAGSFRGNGKLDLAVVTGYYTSSTGGSIEVLLGNGNRTFKKPVAYDVGSEALCIVAADFNGDGKLDLATGNFGGIGTSGTYGGSASIFLGKGDGTFKKHVDYPVPNNNPEGMVVGDLRGDGKLDLVGPTNIATGESEIYILPGNGDGTFASAIMDEPGVWPDDVWADSVVLADVSGDGCLDVLAAVSGTYQTPAIYLLPNACDGTGNLVHGSQAIVYSMTGDEPWGIIAGSFANQGSSSADIAWLDVVDSSNTPNSGYKVAVMQNTPATKITLTSSLNPSPAEGDAVTFTATVKAAEKGVKATPTGTVTFNFGKTTLGTVKLVSGVATLKYSALPVGSDNIVAVYSADSKFNPNTSAPLVEVVK